MDRIVARKRQLTADDVREIRRLVRMRRELTDKALAHRFSVSENVLRSAARGQSYRWVR